MPIPAAHAAADPDIAAITIQATIAALDKPQALWPKQTLPKPNKLWEMPPTLMRLPINKKKGMDIRVMPETCENMRWGTRKSRDMSPPAIKKVAMEAKPIVTAVVTPKSKSNNTPAKIANITIRDLSYLLDGFYGIEHFIHRVFAGQFSHFGIGRCHLFHKRLTIRISNIHALFL